MKNLVRFFIAGNEEEFLRYNDIPIPQIDSRVWLCDDPYRVIDLDYSFVVNENEHNLIDVTVEKEEIDM